MKFELDEKGTNDIRNLLKNLYESLGHTEGVVSSGYKMIDAQHLIDAYKNYIQFIETVLGEYNDELHKRR